MFLCGYINQIRQFKMRNSILLTLGLSFALFSCASKQERAQKYLNQNPEYFAQLCAINFPVTEKLVPGKTIIDTVTIRIPGIEVPCPEYIDQNGQKQQPKAKCPDVDTKYITKFKTDTIYRENTANVIRLKTENAQLAAKNKSLLSDKADLKSVIKKWKIIAAVVSFLLICATYIIFKR